MFIKRILCLLIVMFIALNIIVSCSNDNSGNNMNQDTTVAASLDIEDAATPDETEITADIGSYDFDNKKFTIVFSEDQLGASWPYYANEETGDILNDTVYRREQNVEERFNVDIDWYSTGGKNMEVANALRACVLAGDNSYQLAVSHMFDGFTGLIADGLVYDFNKVPVIDLTKPWWNQSIKSNLEVEGVLLTAVNDLIYNYVDVIIFNKKLLNDYNIEVPYELVYSGKWTWDKLAELSKGVTVDLNGDDKLDDNDQWGFSVASNISLMTRLIHSNGMIMAEIDSEGKPTVENMISDKMQTVVDKYYDLLYNDNRTYYSKKTGASEQDELFGNGQIMFMHNTTSILSKYRDVEFEFGVLPLPKYDEKQENYRSLASTQMMLLPANIEDLELTGVVLEALAYESHTKLVPVLYDVIFENKYMRDEESPEMYKLIRNSLVYDLNWNYGNGNNLAYMIGRTVGAGNTDIASYFEANYQKVQSDLDKVYDNIVENYS